MSHMQTLAPNPYAHKGPITVCDTPFACCQQYKFKQRHMTDFALAGFLLEFHYSNHLMQKVPQADVVLSIVTCPTVTVEGVHRLPAAVL